MTPEALRAFALSLPEAHEEPHFERTSFRAGKKIFATMTADGDEAMVRVAAPELRASLLADAPEVFFSYGGWTTRNGSMGVKLAAAPAKMMEALILESWRGIAPKKLVASFEATSSETVKPAAEAATKAATKAAAKAATKAATKAAAKKRR